MGKDSSSRLLSDNKEAAHWIMWGKAALTNLHLDTEEIASDRLGLSPWRIFWTTTRSNVWKKNMNYLCKVWDFVNSQHKMRREALKIWLRGKDWNYYIIFGNLNNELTLSVSKEKFESAAEQVHLLCCHRHLFLTCKMRLQVVQHSV